MNFSIHDFISLDLPAILTALFAALSCSLLGNFLLLRRLSLMGDAISHSVLPGIVVAFLVTGSRLTFPVFIGAAISGILSVFFVELVYKLGRLDTGAAMGVVFSIFFAGGVLLIEQAAARSVDLDADCLLHGQLETIFWYPPNNWSNFLRLDTLSLLPSELTTSAFVFIAAVIFVGAFYKELTLSAFDPGLASALGFHASFLHMGTMVFLAAAVVASFEAVGSILVIAMIICPPACARMYTDRLATQILLSLVFASMSVIGGYFLGAFGPILVGFSHSLNGAGMMAALSGIFLGGSALFAPAYGVLPRAVRRLRLRLFMLEEDVVALLFRWEESENLSDLTVQEISKKLDSTSLLSVALHRLVARREILTNPMKLTESGKTRARSLVRSHRLWESYLVSEGGVAPGRVHDKAEQLEHFTQSELTEKLAQSGHHPTRDPHGRIIP